MLHGERRPHLSSYALPAPSLSGIRGSTWQTTASNQPQAGSRRAPLSAAVRRYIWIYAALSVLAWIGGTLLMTEQRDHTIAHLESRTDDVASLTSEQTRIALGTISNTLDALTTRLTLTDWRAIRQDDWGLHDRWTETPPPSEEEIASSLRHTLQQAETSAVVDVRFVVTDAAGSPKVWHGTAPPLSALPADVISNATTISGWGLHFSILSRHPEDGTQTLAPALLLSRRFLAPDGSLGGLVAAVVPSTVLEKLFRTVGHETDHRIILLARHQQALFSFDQTQGAQPLSAPLPTRSSAMLLLTPPLPPQVADLSAQVTKSAFVTSADGQDHYYASRKIPHLGLTLITDLNLETALRPWHQRAVRTLAIGLGLFTILTAAAYMLLRQMIIISENNRALTEARNRLETFFDGAMEGILISENGLITDANKAFERISGFDLEDLRGRQLLGFIHPDDQAVAQKATHQRFGPRVRVRAQSANGDWRVLEVQGRQLEETSQQRLTTVHDISHLVDQEQRLTQVINDLTRSNRDLEQFAYVASHDLQEPLRTIASYVGLLNRRCSQNLTDEGREFMDFIVGGAHRMQDLIRDLLDYSRVGTQGRPMVPCSSEKMVLEAWENLSMVASDANAELAFDDLPNVMADRTQIVRLFQNLFSNAIKYRHPDRPCQITLSVTPCLDDATSASRPPTAWTFSVRDTGLGIQKEFAEQVFIIFQRLHGVGTYEGTGIGLAVARRIVERHGGQIWVNTDFAGPGTDLCFTLRSVPPAK